MMLIPIWVNDEIYSFGGLALPSDPEKLTDSAQDISSNILRIEVDLEKQIVSHKYIGNVSKGGVSMRGCHHKGKIFMYGGYNNKKVPQNNFSLGV